MTSKNNTIVNISGFSSSVESVSNHAPYLKCAAFRGRRLAMKKDVLPKSLFIAFAGLLYAGPLHAEDSPFVQTNLVSALSGVAAIPAPDQKTPGEISHSATTLFWSSNQGTSTATLYAVTNKTTVTKVNINAPA